MLKKIVIVLAIFIVALGVLVRYAMNASSPVVAERTFKAPVDQVWALWKNPETIQKWWGPADYTAPVVRSDLRPGGDFFYCMRSAGGTVHCNAGQYIEVVENAKISAHLSFADEKGRVLTGPEIPVPGAWPDTVTVVTDFISTPAGTTVKITETGIPLIMSVFARMGWDQQFDKMEKLLNGGTP